MEFGEALLSEVEGGQNGRDPGRKDEGVKDGSCKKTIFHQK
jgi:hypothetical protein